jgi:hypothetical protein
VVGILLRLLLTFDVRSVADFSPVARGSPKSFKSPIRPHQTTTYKPEAAIDTIVMSPRVTWRHIVFSP